VTQKGQTRDPNALKSPISRKRLEIETPFQSTIPIENGLWSIKWSRDRCPHMTMKGQTRNPNTLRAQ